VHGLGSAQERNFAYRCELLSKMHLRLPSQKGIAADQEETGKEEETAEEEDQEEKGKEGEKETNSAQSTQGRKKGQKEQKGPTPLGGL
jgi:hypothetical protein